jgi:carbon monoxide dehydrogenase subunit G
MELNGEVAIAAPRERVWAALNDNSLLQACIPGCEELVQESDRARARVMVKMGPVRARFNGRSPSARCSRRALPAVLRRLRRRGRHGVGPRRSNCTRDGGGTRLTYAVQAAVAGKLGQVGGRMIAGASKQLADQFFQALQKQLAPAAPVAGSAAEAA